MAISDSHFKEAIQIKKPGQGIDLPPEILFGAVGVLVVFLIVVLIIWKRMNREDDATEA